MGYTPKNQNSSPPQPPQPPKKLYVIDEFYSKTDKSLIKIERYLLSDPPCDFIELETDDYFVNTYTIWE